MPLDPQVEAMRAEREANQVPHIIFQQFNVVAMNPCRLREADIRVNLMSR